MPNWPPRMSDPLLNDKLWLALATTVALVVAALGDIPEKVPVGHELGIFASAISYAYLGAWIFNWVIVTRPRAKQLRDIYRLTWRTLGHVAWDGYYLVKDLQYLAGADPRVEPEDEDILGLCRRITFGRQNNGNENPVEYINNRLDVRNRWLGAVSSLLAYAEHDVLVALAEIDNCSLLVAPMTDWAEGKWESVMVHRVDGPPYPMDLANEARSIQEYFAATERLRQRLQTLKYAPGPVGGGVQIVNTVIWADNWEERRVEP